MTRMMPIAVVGLLIAVTVGLAIRFVLNPTEPRQQGAVSDEQPSVAVEQELSKAGPTDHPDTAPRPSPGFGPPPKALARSPLAVTFRKVGNGDNVFIGDQQITDFPNPHHLDAKVSPSGKFLYVNHRDFGAWKTSVYEVALGRRPTTFETGFGGVAGWAAYDLMYNTHGCGTNCSWFYVYDLDGNELWKTFHGFLDGSGKHVIVEPSIAPMSDVRCRGARCA